MTEGRAVKSKSTTKKSEPDVKRLATLLGMGGVALVAVTTLMGPMTSSAPDTSRKPSKAQAAKPSPPPAPAPKQEVAGVTQRNVFQPLVTPAVRGRNGFRLQLGGKQGLLGADALDAGALLPEPLPAAGGATVTLGSSALSGGASAAAKTPRARTGPEYVGTVTVNGSMLALIQDPRTGEGVYVRAGDAYNNVALVSRVTPAMVEFQTARGTVVLPKTSGTEPPKSRAAGQKPPANNQQVASAQGEAAGLEVTKAEAAMGEQKPIIDVGAVMDKFSRMSPEERRNQIMKLREQLTPEQQNQIRRFMRGGRGGRG